MCVVCHCARRCVYIGVLVCVGVCSACRCVLVCHRVCRCVGLCRYVGVCNVCMVYHSVSGARGTVSCDYVTWRDVTRYNVIYSASHVTTNGRASDVY